jgi:murein DD-endopeptidase MepM/ murein hydrolase activator NlpD
VTDDFDPDGCGQRWAVLLTVAAVIGAVGLGVAALVFARAASGETIGPPFYGPATVGHSYRTAPLRADKCGPLVAAFGDCLYHPYPAVDFNVAYGLPIRAVAAGTVALTHREVDGPCVGETAVCRRPGRFVALTHTRDGLPPVTAYKHLSAVTVVVGQHVARGQVIGRAGRTESPNVHIHFDAARSIGCFNEWACQIPWPDMVFNQDGRRVRISWDGFTRGHHLHPTR